MAEATPLPVRRLGADRNLRLVVFTHDRPGMTVAPAALPFVLFAAGLTWFAEHTTARPTAHDGSQTVRVPFSAPIASHDADIRTRFHVELPDGTRVALRTGDLARAMTVIDTARHERLVDTAGAARYRPAWPRECA